MASCVNRVEGVLSTYRWESKLERDKDTVPLRQTTEGCCDELEGVIRDRTSYELPELIAIPFCNGSSAYLDWLHASVKD